MAITLEPGTTDVICPEEFVSWCSRNVEPADQDSILRAGEKLHALHNNREFLAEALCSELKGACQPDGRQVSPQSVVFSSSGPFRVRVNIWSPAEAENTRAQRHHDQVFSYVVPHDHNFGLLTIGYEGPGYSTVVHEYDRRKVVGYLGEKVHLEYLETTTLSKGKVLYYRPLRDVHAQLYPEAVSISLNLLIDDPKYGDHAQFEFDTVSNRIVGLLRGTGVLRQVNVLELLRLMDSVDENVLDVVESLTRHASKYVRMAAHGVIARHGGGVPADPVAFEHDELVIGEIRRLQNGERALLPALARD